MIGTMNLIRRRLLFNATNFIKTAQLNSNFFSTKSSLIFSPQRSQILQKLSDFQEHLPIYFSQFQPSKCCDLSILKAEGPRRSFNLFRELPRSLSLFHRKEPKDPKKRVPRLILVQNPFTWFMIKVDFSVLKNIWDPTFVEKDFKHGTKQAISRVTNVISEGQFSELNGLLTKAARASLMRELDRNWSERQRSLLALDHDDIQISAPRKVYFIRIADKKYCDVDMAFLSLKWVPINNIEALLFSEIFARFHREYTPHCIPEWTIAYFKVTRFEVLKRR